MQYPVYGNRTTPGEWHILPGLYLGWKLATDLNQESLLKGQIHPRINCQEIVREERG